MKDINDTNSQSEEDRQWGKSLYWLKKGEEEVQIKALKKCINAICKECTEAERKDEDKFSFPDSKFINFLMIILSSKKDNSSLISQFHQIANYPDVVFHFWRCLPRAMSKDVQSSIYYMNVLEFIDKMALPKNYQDPKCIENKTLLFNEEGFMWNYEIVKKAINKVWGRTRSWKLQHNVHKKHLIIMVERIMPHLQNPITWTDMLMDSLNQPGSIAFLALQGIYKLMTRFNIEVPGIYTKLYRMFQPDVFHSRFKPRLFYLADLFLSSTHLPESLVASFIKRCSRLTLIAPVEDICIILHLIGDLMIRHPGLKKLVDNSSSDQDSEKKCKEDPFLEEENDPMETKAIESSLWEIRALERHVLPMVSSAAKFIKQKLPAIEFGVASKLEETGDNIFNRELKRKCKDIALNFEPPKLMALGKGDRVEKYWDFNS